MKLFEDKSRDSYKRMEFGQNIYKYYDSNQRPRISKVRELLNKWFDNYPDSHQKELKDGFKNNFDHAFYELLIHEVFYKQGYILEPHPEIPDTSRHPDFLATKGHERIYLEATTVSYLSEVEKGREIFRRQFIYELNKMHSPNFGLVLTQLEFKTHNFPKVRKMKRFFEKKLMELDPALIAKNTQNALEHELHYSDETILIMVSVLNKTDEAKKQEDWRPIGVQMRALTINSSDKDSNKIKNSFKKKASGYGALTYPFIVCLNLDLRFNLVYDVNWSFYQTSMFNSVPPKFKEVSGVLVISVDTSNIFNNPEHRLILNKHSKNPLAQNLINLSFETAENNLIERQSITKILN